MKPSSLKRSELQLLSVDELWGLHETISRVLTAKILAEKSELEKRLRQINGRSREALPDPKAPKPARRPYPRVFPKYRNPLAPSETWSGRGKMPRWLAIELKSGRKIEDFQIGQDELHHFKASPALVP